MARLWERGALWLWGLALCALLNAAAAGLRPPVGLGGLARALSPETAVETAALFSLGMRRLAADAGLVRLLLYYGSAEEEGVHAHEGRDHAHSWGGGRYDELGPRALRILDADPTFSYAALYSAGALAFNLDRPEEALRVLEDALRRDPRNFQYKAYIAAVGFHKKGQPEGVLRLLEPVLSEPDCPTMIKNMAAFLYVRAGRRREAAALYREIHETSRDEGYRRLAERELARLR